MAARDHGLEPPRIYLSILLVINIEVAVVVRDGSCFHWSDAHATAVVSPCGDFTVVEEDDIDVFPCGNINNLGRGLDVVGPSSKVWKARVSVTCLTFLYHLR